MHKFATRKKNRIKYKRDEKRYTSRKLQISCV